MQQAVGMVGVMRIDGAWAKICTSWLAQESRSSS